MPAAVGHDVVRVARVGHRVEEAAVPGVLAVYDLPDLAAAIAPRSLTLHSPVNAAGSRVSQEELDRAWAVTRKAYEAAGRPKNLKLLAR